MLPTILAVAVALVAIFKVRALTAEVRALIDERDALRAELARLAGEERRPEPAVVVALAATPKPAAITPAEVLGPTPLEQRASRPEPDDAVAPATVEATPVEEAAAPSIDWESFIGVQGALWMGGIAFLLSGVFFARWTVERGLLSAGASLAALIVAGAAALASAEAVWRRGFLRAASPVSAGGIALFSIACLAANGRYALLATPVAFAAMVGVTMLGGWLAVRYRAYATALLSLFTGFALSVALAQGDVAATLVFTYILLLEGAALAIAVRHRWFSLPWLGLAGTLLLQARWCWNFLSPESLPVGILIVLVSALFHLFAPAAAPPEDRPRFVSLGAIGTLGAFFFCLAFATFPRYVPQWPLVFGLVGLIDLAILGDAIATRRGVRLRTAAFVNAVFLGWWSIQGMRKDSGASVMAATVAAIAIVALFGLARRLAMRRGGASIVELRALETAALAAGGGLVLFGTVMVAWGRGSPAGPFLAIATALALILVEVSGDTSRIKGTLFLGTLGLAGLTQIWFLTSVDANTLASYLVGPVVVSLLLTVLAGSGARSSRDTEAEIAVQAAGWIAIGGLFMALRATEGTSSGFPLFLPLSSNGAPLFAALAVQTGVIAMSILRTGWALELPALATGCALYLHLWQRAYLSPDQAATAVVATSLFYLAALLLPLVWPSRDGGLPVTVVNMSAIAGLLFLPPLHAIDRTLRGGAAPGLVALLLAAGGGLLLRAVSFRLTSWEEARRVRSQALFASVAFVLVAFAIGLELERQWATLAWAIEAAIIARVSSRLSHASLPALSALLYAIVAARLLFNPAILSYEPRSLPLLNWILWTYGLAALCAWVGQKALRAAASRWVRWLADGVGLTALMLLFWLTNLEILDFFSTGPAIAFEAQGGYAMKLAFSVGWGAFAVGLLVAGVMRRMKALRYLSLAFMILTVGKVFLYDLAALGGFFRVFSFFGLAAGLVVVSFFYQRFVFTKRA